MSLEIAQRTQIYNGAGRGSIAREFLLLASYGRFALSFLRVHFRRIAGAPGPDTANLTLTVNGPTDHQAVLRTLEGAGVGNDVFFRVPEDELQHWMVAGGHPWGLLVAWTTPDGDNIAWGIEIGLVDLAT